MELIIEPRAPRYIRVNPEDNRIHVFVPIVGGDRIGTDNTCKSTEAIKSFFRNILRELEDYKAALEFELSTVNIVNNIKREEKNSRLVQIDQYIQAMRAMKEKSEIEQLTLPAYPVYPESLVKLMIKRDNLLSVSLRPTVMDSLLRFVNPVFSITRNEHSLFYQILQREFSKVCVLDSRAKLISAVVNTNPQSFEEIQKILKEKTFELFKVDTDFTIDKQGHPVTQEGIDAIIGDDTLTTIDYVDALIGACAGEEIWSISIDEVSPFEMIKENDMKVEKYSILTQFFLAELNVYCYSQGISSQNFGEKLDSSITLSEKVAKIVIGALRHGKSVEPELIRFVNKNKKKFNLNRLITEQEAKEIIQRFKTDYATIEDSPHFDEFVILETSKPGSFVTHQGAICTDFSLMIEAFPDIDTPYFKKTRESTKKLQGTIPHKNIEIETTQIDDHELKKHLQLLLKQGKIDFFCKIFDQNIKQMMASPLCDELLALFTEPNQHGANVLMWIVKNKTYNKALIEKMIDTIYKLPEQVRFDVLSQKNRLGNHVLITALNYNPHAIIPIFSSIRTLSTEHQQIIVESLDDNQIKNFLNFVPNESAGFIFQYLSSERVKDFFGKINVYLQIKVLLSSPLEVQQTIIRALDIGQQKGLIRNAADNKTQKELFILLPAENQLEIFNDLHGQMQGPLLLLLAPASRNQLISGLTETQWIEIFTYAATDEKQNELFQLLPNEKQALIFSSLQPEAQIIILNSTPNKQVLIQAITDKALVSIFGAAEKMKINYETYIDLLDEERQLRIFKRAHSGIQKKMLDSFSTENDKQRKFLQEISDYAIDNIILYSKENEEKMKIFNLLPEDQQLKIFKNSFHTDPNHRIKFSNEALPMWLNKLSDQELNNIMNHSLYPYLDEKRKKDIFKSLSSNGQFEILIDLSTEDAQALFEYLTKEQHLEMFDHICHCLNFHTKYTEPNLRKVLEFVKKENQYDIFKGLKPRSQSQIFFCLDQPNRDQLIINLTDEELIPMYKESSIFYRKDFLKFLSEERQFSVFKLLEPKLQLEVISFLNEEESMPFISGLTNEELVEGIRYGDGFHCYSLKKRLDETRLRTICALLSAKGLHHSVSLLADNRLFELFDALTPKTQYFLLETMNLKKGSPGLITTLSPAAFADFLSTVYVETDGYDTTLKFYYSFLKGARGIATYRLLSDEMKESVKHMLSPQQLAPLLPKLEYPTNHANRFFESKSDTNEETDSGLKKPYESAKKSSS